MSPDDIRQQIELKVVELLRKAVTEGTMTEERSQQIAKLVLEHLQPGMSWQQLYKAIPKLDDASQEISPIIIPYLREYEDKVAQAAEGTVRDFIRQGKYDAAVKLAERVIAQDVDLVWTASAKPTATSPQDTPSMGKN
ncbi:hypothetical protein HY087_01405 [Candidatus Gottesmanbacteria bacterium]|nr:hypothetical protein [Candidatus Gottesmanbacteria bacterium]